MSRISDNGIGIEASELEKIFDVFSRFTTDPQQPGEGIGLSICCKVVQNHLGKISISTQEDVGTTISIIFPVESPFKVIKQ